MKSWHLNRRVDDLSERFKPVKSDVVRLGYGSFTEPEKQLFSKIWEIQEKYGLNPSANVIDANKELIFKQAKSLVGVSHNCSCLL